MAFQISPAVEIREIDLTTVVPQIASTSVGTVGIFNWGPLNEVKLINSEDNLVKMFGKPDNSNAASWLNVANILAYGNKLRVARVANEALAKNSTADGAGLLIRNDAHYEASFANGQASVGLWAGKYAGSLGNGLRVSLCHSSAFSQAMTVSSVGTALTGTDFTTKLAVDSIVRSSGGLERRIASVTDATNAVLDVAFPTNLSSDAATVLWEYHSEFPFAPNTSSFGESTNSVNDEIHIIVIDGNGQFTGIKGQVLERFGFVSLASNAKKEDGTSNYYAQVINRNSQYVRWMDHLPAGTNWGTDANATTYTAVAKPESSNLTGGVIANSISDGDSIRGFNLFLNEDEIDVSLIATGPVSAVVANHVIQNICEVRKDCIAFVSPEAADVISNESSEVEDSIAFRNQLPSSSYGVMDSGWKYQYDRYNDVFRYVPLNGDIAGLCVKTDMMLNPWNSPAGLNRGGVRNVVKLAYNPSKAQRDDLYVNGINPVVSFQGQGTVLWGDKTLLKKPSAFDRINVRRLFIVLEKAISTMAKYSLFELNTPFTRQRFVNIVEPYLREVKARQGISNFRVRCDENNNTEEVVSRNEFIADIFIVPVYSINFVTLNFIATNREATFSEVIGSGIQF